ncbi:MAG: glycosyltransferase N-terminal domain-containing protein [Chitinophagaceae bacterium]
MGLIFYNLFLLAFKAGIRIAALFHPKARKWVKGRRQIFERLEAAITPGQQVIWMHCASLGEFEQGRPLLEALREQYPSCRLLLTFFSPSGYEIRKNYPGADWVFYLPMDGPRNARRFLEIVKPSLVIFVKYEFWFYYLKKVKYRNIPLILVSALFWEKMSFFKWYGAMQRKMLSRFDQLFVQDANSLQLLQHIGLGPITTISGDTRFDRVSAIARQAAAVPAVEQFTSGRPALIAGSTWPEDEALLQQVLQQLSATNIRLVIASHDIGENRIAAIEKLFPQSIRYSEAVKKNGEPVSDVPVLIIDNIGLLSSVYRYGMACYIGGGFGKGIHNTLEAAVYGKPLLFGPVFHKFKEAKDLIAAGAAFSVTEPAQATALLQQWIQAPQSSTQAGMAAQHYVQTNTGATRKILRFIQEKRLLTS